jgi:hypothetical protein
LSSHENFTLETGMERDEDGVVLGSTWLSGSQRLHRKGDATREAGSLVGPMTAADSPSAISVFRIISEKHGGPPTLENLAYSCATCNRAKGTDIAALDDDGKIAPLFNPRTDIWLHHFRRDGPLIIPLTSKRQATVRLLRLNAPERQDERI